jgi:hypothetical protein
MLLVNGQLCHSVHAGDRWRCKVIVGENRYLPAYAKRSETTAGKALNPAGQGTFTATLYISSAFFLAVPLCCF